MKVKFLIQGTNDPVNIYVLLSAGYRKEFKRKTGKTINPKLWRDGKPIGKDTDSKNLGFKLDELLLHIKKAFNKDEPAGIEINGDWLQSQIDLFNGKSSAVDLDVLTSYIQKYIDEAPYKMNAKKEMGLSDGRVRNLKLFKSTILKYEAEVLKGRNILIKNVDLKFLEAYKSWMFKKGYSTNYVGKNVANFRTICRDAFKNDIETSTQVKSFSVIHEIKKAENIIILTEDEQEAIKNAPIIREALINARKWLLLGCLIGQRAGDLLNITDKNIKDYNGIKIIELKQQKTGKLVAIPILPGALDIIERGLPYKISLARFNEYIKDICEAANLNTPTTARIKIKQGEPDKVVIEPKYKVISSHVCRRSFATNFYGGPIPTPLLMKVTGHATEAMFLRYIGKTSYDTAFQMFEAFSKLTPKTKEVPAMEVIRNTSN